MPVPAGSQAFGKASVTKPTTMAAFPAPAPAGPARPRTPSLGELLDAAFHVYKRNFEFFAAISIVLALPDIAIFLLGWSRYGGIFRFFLAPFILATLYLGAAQVILRGPASASEILLTALRRYANFAGVFAGYILAALALLIPPLGIWLIVRWMLGACVLAAEPVKPREALKRSAQLVQGQWWRVFYTMAATLFLEIALVIILAFSVGVFFGLIPGLDHAVRVTSAGVLAALIAALVTPLVPIAFTLLYVDLRVRKESSDLDGLAKSASDAA